MKSKVFLVAISLMAWLCVEVDAGCGGWDDYAGPNANLFYVIAPMEYGEGPTPEFNETVDFWHRYVNGAVSREKLAEAIKYLDADDFKAGVKSKNDLLAALRRRQDVAAINYLKYNTQLYDYTNTTVWDYHKPLRADYTRLLSSINQLRPSAALQARVVFLKMRCNYAMGNYDAVKNIWKTQCSKWANTPLRRRALGYVGGVYYQLKDYVRALEIFDQLGDKLSVNRCVNRLINLDVLEDYCKDNPNSIVLPYVMQDYANYLYHAKNHEVTDEDKVWVGVLRDYDRMMALSRRLLSDSRVKDKFMWQAFVGFLQFADHQDEAACESFDRALQMGGTAEQRTHISMLRFAASLNIVNKPADYATYFVQQLAEAKKIHDAYIDAPYSEETYEKEVSPFVCSTYYLFNYEVAIRSANYCRTIGNDDALFVVYSIFGENPVPSAPGDEVWSYLFFKNYVDEDLTAQQLEERYLSLKENSGRDALVDGLMRLVDADFFPNLEELIGTKYMRISQFAKAESYLSKSTPQLLASQAIAPYLNLRQMPAEPFVRKNMSNMDDETVQSPKNVKLQFCRDMMQMSARLASLHGEEYAEQACRLANMYFQASPAGDLWALTRYWWSCDERHSEYNDYAIDLLHKAIAQTHDISLLKRCYFALASVPQKLREGDNPWDRKVEYDSETRTYVFKVWGSEKEGYDWLKSHRSDCADLYRTCDWLKYYK